MAAEREAATLGEGREREREEGAAQDSASVGAVEPGRWVERTGEADTVCKREDEASEMGGRDGGWRERE